MNGCENEECNIPALAEAKAQGFVVQDYQLMVEDWGSTYVKINCLIGFQCVRIGDLVL